MRRPYDFGGGSAPADVEAEEEERKGQQEEEDADPEDHPLTGDAAAQLEGEAAQGAAKGDVLQQSAAAGGGGGEGSHGSAGAGYLTISQVPSGWRQAVP